MQRPSRDCSTNTVTGQTSIKQDYDTCLQESALKNLSNYTKRKERYLRPMGFLTNRQKFVTLPRSMGCSKHQITLVKNKTMYYLRKQLEDIRCNYG